MDTATDEKPKSKTRKMITSVAIGAVFGFFGAMGFLQLADSGLLGELDNSREIAGLVGLLYVATALFVSIGIFNPSIGAKVLNVEDGDELREQSKMLTYSVIGMFALGAALIVAALAAPMGPIADELALALVVGLVALGWFATSLQRSHVDELMQSVSRDTTSIAFYLMFLIGGGWALLAHLEFTAAPQPLDWLTMFAGLMLVGAYWACGKRGLLAPR